MAQTMESDGVIESGNASVSGKAGSVRERAPGPGSETASLAQRRPQSRWFRISAAIHTATSRVGRTTRGPTSGIPDRVALGHALELRALASASRSALVRPNYALKRSVMDIAPNGGEIADNLLVTDLRAWCPAQRER